MDDNKLNKLREIEYTVHKCCGMCRHGNFFSGNWGTCGFHTYDHKKHNGGNKGSERELSINKFGCCTDYDIFKMCLDDIQHFGEFYDK